MRLRDLDACFLGDYTAGSHRRLPNVLPGLKGAQGVMFQCPKCAAGKEVTEEDGGRFTVGTHYVICWFKEPNGALQVPDDAVPKPGRWHATGNGIEDLTFTGPGSYSVLLTSGCGWHGFVTNGDAT